MNAIVPCPCGCALLPLTESGQVDPEAFSIDVCDCPDPAAVAGLARAYGADLVICLCGRLAPTVSTDDYVTA